MILFDTASPIYLQIIKHIKHQLMCGELAPGQKVPPVREWAMSLEVNPNTMQKALTAMESEGLFYTERTSGRFVTEDTALLEALHQQSVEETVRIFLETMRSIGLQDPQIMSAIEHGMQEKRSQMVREDDET